MAPKSDTPRLGRGMIIAGWIALLLVLTLVFNGHLERRRNPNRELRTTVPAGEVAEVSLLRNRYGHYVASGRINGEPVELLLDTGATDVAVPAALAQKLALPRGRKVFYQTANGVVAGYATRLEKVELGPIAMADVRVHISLGLDGAEVLLGMSFLKHLELIQRGNRLIIRDPAGG